MSAVLKPVAGWEGGARRRQGEQKRDILYGCPTVDVRGFAQKGEAEEQKLRLELVDLKVLYYERECLKR